MVEAAGFPFGAVMLNTPSLSMLEVTLSPLTPDGRVNFCSNTRVRVPPTSLISCFAVIMIVFPSTFTSNSSGLYFWQSMLIQTLSSSYLTA